MPRNVAATDTSPRARRNATSSGLASRWIKEKRQVAAKQCAALARQTVAQAGRDRADAGDSPSRQARCRRWKT